MVNRAQVPASLVYQSFHHYVNRVPVQPTPLATNLLTSWHGDLLHNTSTSLVIFLQRDQMEGGGPELTF